MLISISNNCDYSKLSEGDLIALTRDEKFIGYASVYIITDNSIVLDVDNKASKTFNELFGENIPFVFEI